MERAIALAPIVPDRPDGKVSQKLQIQTWNDDDAAYNNLATRHNALVDHVKKFCQ